MTPRPLQAAPLRVLVDPGPGQRELRAVGVCPENGDVRSAQRHDPGDCVSGLTDVRPDAERERRSLDVRRDMVDRLVEGPPHPAQLERQQAGGGAGVGDADLRRFTTRRWVHPCGQSPAAGGQHGDQRGGYEHSTKHPGSVGPGIAPTHHPSGCVRP